jgi:F-type H+-transporting ATPase subunit b
MRLAGSGGAASEEPKGACTMSAVRILIAVLSIVGLGASPAFAQAEQGSAEQHPEHGYAPPSDEQPPTAGAGHAAGHGEEHHLDASQFFNFFGMDYRGKDQTGGPFGDGVMTDPHTGAVLDEEEPKSAPFVFMVLNFAILLGLIAWKGRPIANKLAVDRHHEIKTALDEAAKLRQQAAAKLAEYDKRLTAADAEIKALVDGIRADAEADHKRILAAAETQAAQMKRDAELRIAAEIETARAALLREVTTAAAAATEQLLREKMTAADQQKLIGGFITDLKSSKEAR